MYTNEELKTHVFHYASNHDIRITKPLCCAPASQLFIPEAQTLLMVVQGNRI